MADCCTPGTGFPTSSLMESLALNQSVVWEEICKIQQAILAAASQCQPGGGQMCTVVAGNTPMTFVSGLTSIAIASAGTGYYVDGPAVKFIPPRGSSASGAAGNVVTNGGKILAINMTSAGTGYAPFSSTLNIAPLNFGYGAVLHPIVNSSGQIVSVVIVNAGSSYTMGDTITATRALAPNGAYIDAVFQITGLTPPPPPWMSSGGAGAGILSVSVLVPGTGYEPALASVQIVSSIDPTVPYPMGAGFTGTVLIDDSTSQGFVSGVAISNGGAGYATYPPYLVISNQGTGASTQVTLAGTSVASIAVITSGSNYVQPITGIVYNPLTVPGPNPPSVSANVTLTIATNTYNTNPNQYYQVYAGTITNKQLSMQMNTVISYFTGLGYTITRQSNPATGTTLAWRVCW